MHKNNMAHNYFREGVFQPLTRHQHYIEHLQQWLKGQPHLPSVSDEHLYLFLNSSNYQITKCKETLENYYTMRTSSPELFSNRDPLLPEIQAILNICEMAPLKWITPEGYRVLLYRMSDYDSAQYDFNNAVKTFCMFNDMRMAEDGLCPGYIALIDLKGLTFGHIGKFNIATMKKITTYLQECQPIVLKAVHFINTSPVLDKLMILAKPFMKTETLELLKFHESYQELSKLMPLNCLPEDYGGELEKVASIHAKQRAMMEKDYAKWYQKEENLKVDESKRTGKKHPYLEISQGAVGSFRKLSID